MAVADGLLRRNDLQLYQFHHELVIGYFIIVEFFNLGYLGLLSIQVKIVKPKIPLIRVIQSTVYAVIELYTSVVTR